MLDINSVYFAFPVLAALLFWRFSGRMAILVTYFGGWLLLPVGHYPPLQAAENFPWWITGLALPADMLVSKAWIVPTVALAGATLFDVSSLRRFRPAWIDLPMLLWCLWPLTESYYITDSSPGPISAALYVTGSWGLSWLLGRIWFCTPDGRVMLLKAIAWSGLACLPVAVLEGTDVLSVYQTLYGLHPFHADGVVRYVGFRPISFFENGNQYGIWVALSALSAVWVAVACRKDPRGRGFFLIALLTTLIAFAAQSIGAILLFLMGLYILVVWRLRVTVPLLGAILFCIVLGLVLHLSGIVPLERIARGTDIGRLALETFRSLGRGSFLWRFSQDIKALGILDGSLVTGTTVWDWWRPAGTRPWGLWLLAIGQYGIIGFLLMYGTLFAVAARSLTSARSARIWNSAQAALPLALIILLALADSLLNAFFYFPAILAAGSIARIKA